MKQLSPSYHDWKEEERMNKERERIASAFTSVQPMLGPIALVFTYRPKGDRIHQGTTTPQQIINDISEAAKSVLPK